MSSRFPKYKSPRTQPVTPRMGRVKPIKDEESLSGIVQNKDASDLEERYAKALSKDKEAVRGYSFNPSYVAGRNMPGEIRLDFMVYLNTGFAQPTQIDSRFAHRTAEQKSEDRAKDAILNDYLRGVGALPVIRVDGNDLQTQEDADRTEKMVNRGNYAKG